MVTRLWFRHPSKHVLLYHYLLQSNEFCKWANSSYLSTNIELCSTIEEQCCYLRIGSIGKGGVPCLNQRDKHICPRHRHCHIIFLQLHIANIRLYWLVNIPYSMTSLTSKYTIFNNLPCTWNKTLTSSRMSTRACRCNNNLTISMWPLAAASIKAVLPV